MLKNVFEETFKTFQKLDGSIKLTYPEEMQETIKTTNQLIAESLKTYEINWRTSYRNLIQLMKENPVGNKNQSPS